MQKYCILNDGQVIDLTTGYPILEPLSSLSLVGSKLFYFDREAYRSLLQINNELNAMEVAKREVAERSISKMNALMLQVSTDYRNFDEVAEGLHLTDDDYKPLAAWINRQVDLKQKYLNLLFKRLPYWEEVLHGRTPKTEGWSDQMLATGSYNLIDQLYNHPEPVDSVGQTTFKYLEHIPARLKEYFEAVFVTNNYDEPELEREYRRFSQTPIRVNEVSQFKKFKFFGMELRLTYGGLHYNADNYYERPIKLIDFKAYYPNLMITFGLQSRRIAVEGQRDYLKEWLKIRNDLSDPTKMAKIPDDFKEIKTKFKIFQSSLYGCLRDTNSTRKSNLYDPLTGLVLTFTGQWIMLAFIKQLKPFIRQVYGINTDGLFLEWRNEAEDGQRIKKVVDDFYNLTHIRYTYGSFDRCFFFKFNQLLCYRAERRAPDGTMMTPAYVYAKGDYFKNYEEYDDDDYYITKALVDLYLNQKVADLRGYPTKYFRKTLTLKYNMERRKRFIFYESQPSIITREELQARAPELFVELRKISTNFLFESITYHKIAHPDSLSSRDLLTVYPSTPGPNSYMIRTYNARKAETYDTRSRYFYHDVENRLKFVFEYHEFDEDPAQIGWSCRVKYLSAKIVNGADWYTPERPGVIPDINYQFCQERLQKIIGSLPADSYFKRYPQLKKEAS